MSTVAGNAGHRTGVHTLTLLTKLYYERIVRKKLVPREKLKGSLEAAREITLSIIEQIHSLKLASGSAR